MLPLSKEVIAAELTTAKAVLEKWIKALEEGIPVVDRDCDPVHLQEFISEFCGEMQLCATKCESIAEIFMNQMR